MRDRYLRLPLRRFRAFPLSLRAARYGRGTTASLRGGPCLLSSP
ncbi:hypothetical protein APV28_0543 [Comamonas testosteroni]|nr:hypothetical protein APV28_0543 [Comamonas testosteroni]